MKTNTKMEVRDSDRFMYAIAIATKKRKERVN